MEKIKQWVKALKEDQRGLTLVELLAVIVILAIVGLIAFIAIGNVIENSKQDAHISNAIQVISAAELNMASGGTPEGSAVELDEVGELINPWNNEDDSYDFTIINNEGAITVTSSAGADVTCEFTTMSKTDLNHDRDDICGETGPITGEEG